MQSTNLNRRPYWDDWNPGKRFSRILFRPMPIKVQTRELNQMQTILQDQIEKLGNHLFKDGSMVIPGGLTITNAAVSLKFTLAGGTEFTDLEGISELYVLGKDNNAKARVLSLERDLSAHDTMLAILEMTEAGNADGFHVNDNLYFQTYDVNDNFIRIGYGIAAAVTGSIVARMTKGVYFIRGMFLDVDDATLIVDKTSNITSHRIGFKVTETIVTETEDESLYSNAQGTINSKAPGAHRLRIDLVLSRFDYDAVVEDFVELAKVRDGKIQSMVTQSTYNILEDTLAQRTYETNGDYNVSTHQIDIREHLKVNNNGGVFNAADGGDESKFVSVMKPGISYVRGRRIENVGEELVIVDKARDTDVLNNTPVAVATGNYLVTKNSKGVPVISRTVRYKLLNASGVTQATALCISAERNSTEFRLYMRDLVVTGDASTITKVSYEESGITMFSAELESNQFNQSSMIDLIFSLPVFGVKTLAPTGSVDINYTVLRTYKVTLDNSGAGSISAPLGYSFSPEFSLYSAAKSDGSEAQFDISGSLSLTGSPVGSALQISLGSGNANQSINLLALMIRTTATIKTKTITETTETVTFTSQTSRPLANHDGWKLVSVKNDTGEDVTSSFVLDGGQRDAGYYKSNLLSSAGAISGTYTVVYQYFAHSSGDFFSADSYTSMDYKDIPNYTSSTSGAVYGLADSLDFRPKITNGTSDTDMVRPNTAVILDTEYYLPRIDAIYLADNGVFGVARGISSNNLASPAIPANAMRLYELLIPPYTPNIDDIQIRTIDNRRYTMRDIGKLETRISNVEYYTSLSQLESSAMTQQVFDPITGNPRFKNGIAADPFKDFRLIDDLSEDWMGSIDTENGRLRPFVQQNVVDMTPVGWNKVMDGMVVCNYTPEISVNQEYATTTINVNPYAVFNWEGFLKINPTTDYWFENYYVAPRIINETINTRGTVQEGSVYGTWRTVSVSDRVWEPHGAGGVWWGYRYRTTVSARDVTTYTYTDKTTTTMTGEQIVETQVIPYMREIDISFDASGLRPFTRMYAFFSGRDVNLYCKPNGGNFGDPITTDANGAVKGIFRVPQNDTIKFNTGDNVFRLTDSPVDSKSADDTLTNAEIVHKSFGKKQGIQKTFVNTRVLGYTASTRTETSTSEVVVDQWRDPIAQSFMVATKNGGEYIEGVEVFFSTKSRDVPITLEIREMENGLPSHTVITRKTLNPSEVAISTDSSGGTKFTFDYPVYLQASTEFAIVLLANTQDYNAYIAEMGKKNLLSNEYIAKQPYTGVFFTSSNGSTWSPNQMADMKFRIYRCNFAAGQNVVTFDPKLGPKQRPLGLNTLNCVSGSSVVTVFAPGHGLVAGNNVTLSELTGGCGFTPEQLNKTFTVTDASYTSFKIDVGAAADSNGQIGGDNASFLGNYLVDMFYASVTNSALEGSILKLEYRYRDATSNSMSDWAEFETDTDVALPTEGIYRQVGDFQIRATMTRSENNVYTAPMIDGDDLSVIFNSYGVDPFEDVFKYVTKDIGFDNPCSTVKLFFGAMLPSQSSMKVQVKLLRAGQEMDSVAWEDVTPTSPLVNDGSTFFEYEYDKTVASNNPFVGLKVRALVRGNRVAPPSFKDFRLIALA
ncbi:hypothetical protein selz4t1_44 [Salmonella phage selz]|nr:hypothetical protein selz4t1_44 [Salmonella phage selz]UJQ70106.1 hypothetical protein selz4t2_44 [Salmonella phage selz]UJQ70283.1 hypothetical protein selz4t3_37 [Salmonella phage selz]